MKQFTLPLRDDVQRPTAKLEDFFHLSTMVMRAWSEFDFLKRKKPDFKQMLDFQQEPEQQDCPCDLLYSEIFNPFPALLNPETPHTIAINGIALWSLTSIIIPRIIEIILIGILCVSNVAYSFSFIFINKPIAPLKMLKLPSIIGIIPIKL